ncbi:MAG: hypothetical protein ACTHLE_10275 [Agriterribacter sp.]
MSNKNDDGNGWEIAVNRRSATVLTVSTAAPRFLYMYNGGTWLIVHNGFAVPVCR